MIGARNTFFPKLLKGIFSSWFFSLFLEEGGGILVCLLLFAKNSFFQKLVWGRGGVFFCLCLILFCFGVFFPEILSS